MTSTTTVLKPYFPFDADAIAEKCSKGRNPKYAGKTVAEVKDIWQKKGELGTRVHLFAEEYIDGKFVTVTDKYEIGLLKYLQRLKYDFALTEVQIVNPEWGISGMIDLLLVRDGKIWIYDWKTNSRIDTKSFNGEKCPAELCMFDNCSFVKYQMQLSIYRHILASDFYDIEIAGQKIVHINEEGVVREYSLPYLPNECDMVINKFLTSSPETE